MKCHALKRFPIIFGSTIRNRQFLPMFASDLHIVSSINILKEREKNGPSKKSSYFYPFWIENIYKKRSDSNPSKSCTYMEKKNILRMNSGTLRNSVSLNIFEHLLEAIHFYITCKTTTICICICMAYIQFNEWNSRTAPEKTIIEWISRHDINKKKRESIIQYHLILSNQQM